VSRLELQTIFGPDLVEAIECLVDERVQVALEAREQTAMNGSPWLSQAEAAKYLRISERTLQRQGRRNRLRPSTALGRPLFHRDDLDQLAKGATGEDVAPTTPPPRRRVPSLDRIAPEV